MAHWTFGHNMAGYLPESEPVCAGTDWREAFDAFADAFIAYAQESDELHDEARESESDETGTDEAYARSFIADVRTGHYADENVGTVYTDNDHHAISWWLVAVPDAECEQDHDD